MPLEQALWVFAVIVLFAVIQKCFRNRSIRKTAQRLGLSYSRSIDSAAMPRKDQLQLLPESGGYNVLKGRLNGIEVILFDAKFRDSGGSKDLREFTKTVMLLRDPKLDLPNFVCMSLAKPLALISNMVPNPNRITFDKDPRFSKNCILTGEDREAIEEIFHSKVRRLVQDMGCDVMIEGNADILLIITRPVTPKKIGGSINAAKRILNQMKS